MYTIAFQKWNILETKIEGCNLISVEMDPFYIDLLLKGDVNGESISFLSTVSAIQLYKTIFSLHMKQKKGHAMRIVW